MIKVKVLKKENMIYGFDIVGHAGFDKHGKDIVCSAVSVLMINTINSISNFTKDDIVVDEYVENDGHIKFLVNGIYSKETEILLKSLEYGLYDINEQYGKKYIKIEEVQ
ncbi:MAG TPA: ribosomal-processing cysteine protease Prp [Clostridiales bacterium]|nr:MAG: hypothetical protein A2Y18_03860 [Clostridiales bacterium GWD2_32_19]HCC08261.1 ribosomal-processing cysteine protease Prp [Clostridiales bacterium]